MKIRITTLALALSTPLVGCDESMNDMMELGPVPAGASALMGRIDGDQGNQRAGAAAMSGATITADTIVVLDAEDQPLGEGRVGADGRFHLEGLNPISGPVRVEAQQGDERVGAVMLPEGLPEGERVVIMPISAETTAEAEAFVTLRATHGEAVDPIALTAHITEQMALSTEGAALATAAWQAQVAERATLAAELGIEVTTEAMVQLRQGAFDRLTIALNEAADGEAEAEAWARFRGEVVAALGEELGADADDQAAAESAAGARLTAELEGEVGYAAAVSLASQMVVNARAVVMRTIVEGNAEAEARFEAALQRWAEAHAEASSAVEVEAAHSVWLEALVSGGGETVAEALIEGEGRGEVGLLEGLSSVVGTITSELRGEWAGAFAGDGFDGRTFGALQAEIRGQVEARLLGAPESVIALAVEALTSAALHASVEGEGDGEADDRGEVELAGTLQAALGGLAEVQSGAAGLVEGVELPNLRLADAVEWVRIGLDGAVEIISEGQIEGDHAVVEMPRDADIDGMTQLWLRREGEIIGAVVVPEGEQPAEGERRVVPTITTESTVEALLLAEGGGELDPGLVTLFVDGATAAAVTAEGEMDALFAGIATASATFSQALGARGEALAQAGFEARQRVEGQVNADAQRGEAAEQAFRAELSQRIEASVGASAEAQAQAMAEAARVFEATVEAFAEAQGGITAEVVEARARIEQAIATTTTLRAEIAAWGEAEGQGQIVAVNELVIEAEAELRARIESAADAEAIAAAGADFREQLAGDGESALSAVIEGGLLVEAAVRTAAESVSLARASLEAALALTAEGQAQGALDSEGAVTAHGEAFATFDGAVRGAIEGLSTTPQLEGSASLIAELLVGGDVGR